MSTDPRIRATRPEIWFNNVTSLCPEPGCGRAINGKHHVTVAGHIVMRQFCPDHGHRAVLVSKDVEWFTRFEQMAAMLPPRAERSVPTGTCCVPVLELEAHDAAERARRLLWLRDASPGSVHFVSRAPGELAVGLLSAALAQARQVGTGCVSVLLPAARLLEREIAAAVEAAGALAHVLAEDPALPELLERRAGLPVVMVSRVDRPAAELAEGLAAAYRRFRDSPAVVSWEVVPCGEVAAAWYRHDHHPSKGPEGVPSNGPVPVAGPVPATLSEALPLVQAASGGVLEREAFFPLQRFHPPGSGLAVVRCTASGTLEALNGALSPRTAIDLIVGRVPATSQDPGVLAVRALFGQTGRMHPRMVATLVSQGLGAAGALVAEDHRLPAEAAGTRPVEPLAGIKTVIVHHPLTRQGFDRNRHLRACPIPRADREECNEACVYRIG